MPPTAMDTTIGRIVHFRDPNKFSGCRPAIVVQQWSPDILNLQIFVDGSNDGLTATQGTVWATSVPHSNLQTETEDGGVSPSFHLYTECLVNYG